MLTRSVRAVGLGLWRSALPYWRGSRQSEVPSSTVAFWQMFQMLKYIKTGMEVKPVTPSQASMKMYVSMMNYREKDRLHLWYITFVTL